LTVSQAFLQESITSKWWLSSKVEAWNFTKKILNLSIKWKQTLYLPA